MFSFLQKRSIFGFPGSEKNWSHPVDLSSLLTKYKNYCSDEYSTLDDMGMSVPPMACKFAQSEVKGHILSVVDEDGFIVLYNINKSGQEAVIKTWQVHSNAVFDVEWVQDDHQIITASGDQTIALWDVEKMHKLESFRGHSSSVRSVALRTDDNAVFASGSRDGHIMMWDKRVVHKDGAITSVNVIYNAHALQQNKVPGKARKKKQHLLQPKDCQQSVTAVVFQRENYLVSAGSVDGCIKIWDMRKTYKNLTTGATPLRVIQYQGTSSRKHGYSSLTFDQSRCRLFASCTDDIVYEFNLMSSQDNPVHCFRGHKNSSFYVKTVISPDNQFLLSGSSDHHAYIWQINKPESPPVVLKAHDAEVSGVEWCQNDFTKLVTLSDDAKTKFWRIYSRELKSNLHPQWFGRARRFSRDRSTSTAEIPSKPVNLNIASASPASSPQSSPKPVSRSPSVREWLKRKASVDPNSLSGPSPVKTMYQTPNENFNADGYISPLARRESTTLTYRKRPFNVSQAIHESEQTASECSHDSSCTGNNGDHISGGAHSIASSCNKNSEDTPTKKFKSDDFKESSNPLTKSCFSPVKPHRNQMGLSENIQHPSPQKLKHALNLEGSPVSSPKRLCLTKLDTNGAFHRLSSARQSLFGDKEQSGAEFIKDREDSSDSNTSNDVVKHCDISFGLPKPTMYQQTDSSDCANTISSNSRTPHDKGFTSKSPESLNSPTHNLPNLVKDSLLNVQSVSPHCVTSPQTRKMDWLTQLRLSKNRKCCQEEETLSQKRQSPSSARSSPKVLQNVKMRKIQAYFTAHTEKGN